MSCTLKHETRQRARWLPVASALGVMLLAGHGFGQTPGPASRPAEAPAVKTTTTPAENPLKAEAPPVPTKPLPYGGASEPNDRGVVITGDRVDLHLQGTDLRSALKLLSTQSETNIIASKDVQGTVTADLYKVTFTEALDAILSSTGYAYVRKGNFIYVMSVKELNDQLSAQRQPITKVFHLNYITANDAKTLITPVLSKDGTISVTPPATVGVGTTKTDAGGNALATEDVIIVRDYPESLEKVTAILRELDCRPQQVLIEATILRATLDERNALGVDFNVLSGIDFHSLNATSNGVGVTANPLPSTAFDTGASQTSTNFNKGIDTGGLSVGIVANDMAFFIRALESVTDTTVLANPKLLVMNKQRGEVMVGNRDGYITTTFTETTATQTVQFLETGTQLVVRPFISTDGYVRLEIHPEDSTGGINADRLPFEQTTEVTSNVLVRDGHTIVIGGLFRERTNNGRAQVPLLGNLPIAGNLFRRRTEQTTREEVIVLITPHIIKQPLAEAMSAQLAEDVERMRIGLRQGLMWFGTERLSQTYMGWARQHLAKGQTGCAMWDLNMVLSLEPRTIEAIRLKERLTRQAIWANEARYSSVSTLVGQMIMMELGEPPATVVHPQRPMNVESFSPEAREAMGLCPSSKELPLRDAARPGRWRSPGANQPTTAPTSGNPFEPRPQANP